MRNYTRILPYENKRRISKLKEFKSLVISYFATCSSNEHESLQESQRAREEINKTLYYIHDVVLSAGLYPVHLYQPPAVTGGVIANVDLFFNIFQTPRLRISPLDIIDYLDRAIGIYETNKKAAKIRAINPFFYLNLILGYIASFPFFLIGQMGFNRAKAESSIVGRITKGIVSLIAALAGILTILSLLGYIEPVKVFIRSLISKG